MAATARRLEQLRAAKAAGRNEANLAKLRAICLAYPEAVEVEQFGEPWFKAGKKAFCVYGDDGSTDGAAFNVGLMDQAELCRDARFHPTHYVGQHGWTSMTFGKPFAWDEVRELVDIAYRRVALKRMLQALEAQESGARPGNTVVPSARRGSRTAAARGAGRGSRAGRPAD